MTRASGGTSHPVRGDEPFTNSPVANYRGEMYSLPFNMYTFNRMWGVSTPEEARARIDAQRSEIASEPRNLEASEFRMVGRKRCEAVQGYTEKQWGRDYRELLPAFIIRRLPVRLTYDNNYFSARFQESIGGYTQIIEKMIAGAESSAEHGLSGKSRSANAMAENNTGPIDAYFDYALGSPGLSLAAV